MTIVVALSGGVDSAVAAGILKSKGYEVIGVHMRNWDATLYENLDKCSGRKDYFDAVDICKQLGIPLHQYNFSTEYWQQVFDPYLDALEENLNTNPDITCNSQIKFGVLLERVIEDFGEDIKLATGHWAKVVEDKGRYYLEVCANEFKDQTYFLSSLTEKQLSKAVFPLEDISSKEEIRQMAKEMGINIWDKRDSVGICFIGKRNFRHFIGNYISHNSGDLVDIGTGEILGQHEGTHLYVLHQRDGLFLKGYEEKYYVCKKDIEKNIVYLCRKSEIEKYLYKTITRCERLHWISDDLKIKEQEEIYIKVRHSPQFTKVKVIEINEDYCVLEHKNMYVTTPGQAIVFYRDKKRCLGMGIYVDS